jgi:myo-inositol 2-dehydrogenase/D-chiro-inositol 1-dehydrogenase
MATRKRVNAAIVGLGRIGAVHFDNASRNLKFRIRAVVEPIDARRQDYAERADAKAYHTLTEALADAANPIDAVIICTPTGTHPELIKEALQAGKQVFCEKPIAYDTKIVDDLYNLAKQKGLVLLCGFQRRHDASFAKVKTLVDEGRIGKLHKIRTISRDNPCPPLAYLQISGGIIFDCASHDCDEMRWYTGEDPELVYAVGSAFVPGVAEIPDVDTLEITFKFPSGRLGSVDISRISTSGYDQRVEAHGEKGTLYAENERDTTTVLATKDGFTVDPNKWSFPTRYVQAYSTEMDHFANLCLGIEKVPKLSHEDVHKNCVILHAANDSLKSGLPVKIKYDEWNKQAKK